MEKNVLILEDNVQTANVISKILLDMSYRTNILKVATVEAAYRNSLEKTIDVFIIDIILDTTSPGDISGINFAQRIRTLPKYLFTPIIFITALADPELHAYRNIHCFGYIEKPFSSKQVSSLLSQALNYTTCKEENIIIYLRKEGVLYSIHIEDVVYIQVQHHIMKIYLRNEDIEIPYKTIKSILDEVDSKDIIQCNRYTIVNRQYIDNIDYTNRYIKLKGINKVLEIGVVYKKLFMSKLDA